ncbi:SIR2 family protein [Janthinobacterium fluminis]|uniref:SIR2 family protein n=1 Tax=Janthinobacterium fluminis TaxID=2987524 RepID=A0ABT5K6R3_9BURK|nr:SIR2 family protein [Janthinobacterium fluminis]MDC8760683.1 SIR2 family protein [Janthinobacterium fluminis]
MPAEIDPISSLAFSISTNKGVYALLLGSGVSRSSKIPTGWEITLDLVRKVAALQGAECEPDPSAWYLATFGKQPDYSELLDVLCKSPAERQQLVRAYLEPTDEERSEGDKQPTPAHRAIANLVKAGFVRVILTTNFDKLTELALHDVGVVPTVLSSVDHIAGALPLVHTACTIIKIHGDYLDTRIRNTASELAEYPEEFKQLLDRVFDEYGLIVCGWSAEWDDALRAALVRAPYRRFSTYWATRGDPGMQAQDLIKRRAAHVVPIGGADAFFSKLGELVTILESFSQPHPLSTAAAVASLKKYLSEEKYAIQLDDLVSEETNRVLNVMHGQKFDMSPRDLDSKSLGDRVHAYEAVSTTLIEMAAVAGYWAKPEQLKPWLRSVAKVSQRKHESGLVALVEFQRYPACLIAYALGLGAVAAGNLNVLRELFSTRIVKEHRNDVLAVVALNPVAMFERGTAGAKLLPGKDRHYLPLNSWLEDYFAPFGGRLFQSDQEYRNGFDKLEFLWSLAYAHSIRANDGHFWVPFGNFIYRSDRYSQLMKEFRDSLTTAGDQSPYVLSSIFGTSAQQCLEILDKIEPVAAEWSRQRW